MSEDAQIRRDNLATLQLGPKELTEKLGRTYSFWRDLVKSNKSFGEKLARSIEDGLELPRGWLDRPPGANAEERIIAAHASMTAAAQSAAACRDALARR